jgi:two-component system sensor histidine kinase AgrC
MVWGLVSFFSYFIECGIIYAFLSFIFASRNMFLKNKWLKIIIFLLGFAGIVIYNQLPQTPIPFLIIGIILQSFVAIIIFEGRVLYKILVVFSLFAALAAADLTTSCGVGLLLKIDPSSLASELIPYIACFCISKVFLIIILSLICQFKAIRDQTIKFHYWLLLIIIPIVSIICLFSLLNFSYFLKPKGYNLLLAALASAGVLVINASVFYIFQKISESTRLQTQYLLVRQNVEDQYNQFQDIKDIYEQTRIFKHDIDKHLSCISSLIKQKEYGEVQQYLKGLNDTAQLITIPLLSGNPVIDTIINTKYSVAKQRGIQIQISISDIGEIPIEQIDLCAIISNLLDNAIESCEKITNENIEKFLKINIYKKSGGIIMSVTNSVEDEPILEGQRFVTTKQDKIHHGIGLKSVQQSVEKYHGILETGFDENQFSAVVFFQI